MRTVHTATRRKIPACALLVPNTPRPTYAVTIRGMFAGYVRLMDGPLPTRWETEPATRPYPTIRSAMRGLVDVFSGNTAEYQNERTRRDARLAQRRLRRESLRVFCAQ